MCETTTTKKRTRVQHKRARVLTICTTCVFSLLFVEGNSEGIGIDSHPVRTSYELLFNESSWNWRKNRLDSVPGRVELELLDDWKWNLLLRLSENWPHFLKIFNRGQLSSKLTWVRSQSTPVSVSWDEKWLNLPSVWWWSQITRGLSVVNLGH